MPQTPPFYSRFLAGLIALYMAAAPGLEAAQVIRPGAVTAPVTGITPVSGASFGKLGGASSQNTALNGRMNLQSGLPAVETLSPQHQISASASASPDQAAAQDAHMQSDASPKDIGEGRRKQSGAVSPTSQSRSPKSSIKTARDALAQDKKAAKVRPGLAHLGSRIKAPSQNGSLASQREDADRFFRQKAGFAHSDEISEDFLFHAFAPESADPRKSKGEESEPTADPIYPSRNIRFGGKTFPSVAFRPDRPVESEIIKAIDASKKTIRIALYEFKNREILKALRRAKERKVKVEILIDAGHANPGKRDGSDYWPHRSLELQSLINAGFEVKVLKGQWKWGIMHNKIAVFDGKLGLFGSYNWSYTSERNHFENVVFTTVKKRVDGLDKLITYLNENAVPFSQSLKNDWPEELPKPPPADSSKSVRFNGLSLPSWIFTPDARAEKEIVRVLDAAKKSADMSMFTFTSPAITEALIRAKDRGVRVRALLDLSQSGQPFMEPFVQYLAFHGVETKTLAGPNPDGPQWAEKDHNKFTIVDGKMVMTGSLNYTKSGFLTNFENVFFLDEAADAKSFALFFEDMFSSRRAQRIVPPANEPALPTEEEIINGLRGPPVGPPPAPVWPDMPAAHEVPFNGEKFPSSAVRPQHPIKDLIVQAIDKSKKNIRVALYEFDLPEIMDAMRRAKKRGVNVSVILDFSNTFPRSKNSRGEDREASLPIQALIKEGFDVSILRGVKAQGIMHNKIGIFDDKMVSFGSYNWSRTAEYSHFESVKFENDKARVDFYVKYWKWMKSYSVAPSDAELHKWNQAWKHGQKEGRTTPVDNDHPVRLNGEKFPRSAVSPLGLAEETIIRAIRAAKSTIDIAMFSFYSARVAEELLRAKERGVHVRLTFDRMQSKIMKLDNWFAYYDFDVRVVTGPNPYGNVYWEKNHNKFMIMDGKMLEIGSYNFTGNAEENSFENINFYDDPVELAFFAAYFEMLYRAGWTPLKPEAPPEGLPTPAEFFDPQRISRLQADLDSEFEL
jgi:phosphatidylserine/phosphatidylglycerophosphate/cardiolipin synthase-like enzyme